MSCKASIASDLASQSLPINLPLETSPLQAFSILSWTCTYERERVQVWGKSMHMAEGQEMVKNTPQK